LYLERNSVENNAGVIFQFNCPVAFHIGKFFAGKGSPSHTFLKRKGYSGLFLSLKIPDKTDCPSQRQVK